VCLCLLVTLTTAALTKNERVSITHTLSTNQLVSEPRSPLSLDSLSHSVGVGVCRRAMDNWWVCVFIHTVDMLVRARARVCVCVCVCARALCVCTVCERVWDTVEGGRSVAPPPATPQPSIATMIHREPHTMAQINHGCNHCTGDVRVSRCERD
jgi:hypothetical protein